MLTSNICYLILVAFVWELTKKKIHLPLSCLQGGHHLRRHNHRPSYRGISFIRNNHPPRITIGPKAQGYCRVLRGGCFL